jgi:hypothetical protein
LEIFSRKEAIKLGLKMYFTGQACRNGHTAPRQTSNCTCYECYYTYRKSTSNTHHFKKVRSEQNRRYYQKNRHEAVRRQIKRKVRIANATPPWYGDFDDLVLQEAYDLASLRAEATGFQWHVDHMIPLRARKACGLHCGENIQVIPARLNWSKKNRMIYTERDAWLLRVVTGSVKLRQKKC